MSFGHLQRDTEGKCITVFYKYTPTYQYKAKKTKYRRKNVYSGYFLRENVLENLKYIPLAWSGKY